MSVQPIVCGFVSSLSDFKKRRRLMTKTLEKMNTARPDNLLGFFARA
jgi:hypothetical protein